MIYLDCAATSLHKPAAVRYAVADAVSQLSSPGRGGHPCAMAAAETLLDCRLALGELLGVENPERVVFTSSATHGLNIAIKSLVAAGDRVVVSGYEHNAVMRPLKAIGAEVVVAASPLFRPEEAIEAFRQSLPGADAAICCHVSNVFGYVLPVHEIAALCREYEVPLIVDMSQSAGSVDIDFDRLDCAFAAMPGHKGLLGPQGTGVLLCGSQKCRPLMEGGTGSDSAQMDMPGHLPDRLEAGTHNMPGIAGLLAGVNWVKKNGTSAVFRREKRLMKLFLETLGKDPRIGIYESPVKELQTGVLSLQLDNLDCESVAERLARVGIAVRAGLHCAPLAHETAGTLQQGTVRFSFSPFNTEREVATAARALWKAAAG